MQQAVVTIPELQYVYHYNLQWRFAPYCGHATHPSAPADRHHLNLPSSPDETSPPAPNPRMGFQDTPHTSPELSDKVDTHWRDPMSQILTVWSHDPLAASRPSGEMSTDRTQDECPANEATTPTLEFVADTEEFRVS